MLFRFGAAKRMKNTRCHGKTAQLLLVPYKNLKKSLSCPYKFCYGLGVTEVKKRLEQFHQTKRQPRAINRSSSTILKSG